MKSCRFFLQRPFGAKPYSNYALSSSDVKEFFVKIYFKEKEWEERLKEENPFDEDFEIVNVSTFGNGAIVDFKCEEWVLRALQERYEYRDRDGITIDGQTYTKKRVDGKWQFVSDEHKGKPLFS
jgi:hypothetical protein